jgi:hypothetical protein
MPSVLEQHLDVTTLYDEPVTIQKVSKWPKPQREIQEIAQLWMTEFNNAIKNKRADDIAELFQPNGTRYCISK